MSLSRKGDEIKENSLFAQPFFYCREYSVSVFYIAADIVETSSFYIN